MIENIHIRMSRYLAPICNIFLLYIYSFPLYKEQHHLKLPVLMNKIQSSRLEYIPTANQNEGEMQLLKWNYSKIFNDFPASLDVGREIF